MHWGLTNISQELQETLILLECRAGDQAGQDRL